MTFNARINGQVAVIEIPDQELAAMCPKRLLKVSEVAEQIGQSRTTVFEWAKRRVIPSIKVGRNRRFDLDAVLRSLNERGECKAKRHV